MEQNDLNSQKVSCPMVIRISAELFPVVIVEQQQEITHGTTQPIYRTSCVAGSIPLCGELVLGSA
jgi:hypothetical protein